MIDPQLVASLIRGLETRFLLITYSWCTASKYKAFELCGGGRKPDESQERWLKKWGADEAQRIRNEFLFAWLVQIEDLARAYHRGVVRASAFDETMLYCGGQTLYDLFASGFIKGPYVMPWDNTESFRNGVLKPVAQLMRSFEHDEALKIPPEAKQLLELRGLTFDF